MGDFSDILMDHFSSPRNTGPMTSPDVVGQAGTLGHGPFMVLYLRIQQDRVVDAKFRTYGCGVTIACGSLLTEIIIQLSVRECLDLTAEHLTEAIGGVPPDKLHSPVLAIAALRHALNQYHQKDAPLPASLA